nr:PEP-utilizing enzyme [Promicromonospora citrea]
MLGVAAGVVTQTGGALSHAAIVARERGIPPCWASRTPCGSCPPGGRDHEDPAPRQPGGTGTAVAYSSIRAIRPSSNPKYTAAFTSKRPPSAVTTCTTCCWRSSSAVPVRRPSCRPISYSIDAMEPICACMPAMFSSIPLSPVPSLCQTVASAVHSARASAHSRSARCRR